MNNLGAPARSVVSDREGGEEGNEVASVIWTARPHDPGGYSLHKEVRTLSLSLLLMYRGGFPIFIGLLQVCTRNC